MHIWSRILCYSVLLWLFGDFIMIRCILFRILKARLSKSELRRATNKRSPKEYWLYAHVRDVIPTFFLWYYYLYGLILRPIITCVLVALQLTMGTPATDQALKDLVGLWLIRSLIMSGIEGIYMRKIKGDKKIGRLQRGKL